MKRLAELKRNDLPAFCYTRDEINFNKRILRKDFIDVRLEKLFLKLIIPSLNNLILLKLMLNVSNHLSSDLFNFFIEFFENSIVHFVQLANLSSLNRILRKLFKLIDSTQVYFVQ